MFWQIVYGRHLTSQYEDEEFDDDVTKEHPEDRIADANEDYENINTDWSKAYASENKIDSEISVVKAYNRKRKLKRNKVSFQDIHHHHTDLPKQNTDSGSHTHTVFVELNPAALNLERKLEKADSIESAETEIFEMTSSDSLSTVAEEADNSGSDENDSDFTVETLKNKWSKM